MQHPLLSIVNCSKPPERFCSGATNKQSPERKSPASLSESSVPEEASQLPAENATSPPSSIQEDSKLAGYVGACVIHCLLVALAFGMIKLAIAVSGESAICCTF